MQMLVLINNDSTVDISNETSRTPVLTSRGSNLEVFWEIALKKFEN